MTFDEEAQRSVSPLRVLVEIASYDVSSYSALFSTSDITPVGSSVFYEGRLVEAPSVSLKRDSTFFGVLLFSSSSISLHNADGALDALCDSVSLTGGAIIVKVGFDDLPLSSFSTIFTGYVERVTVGEQAVDISVSDLRKRLAQANGVSRLQYNAVTFIQDILTETYGITFDSTYFDTAAWETARAAAHNVSRYHPDDDTVDAALQDIVGTTLGFFFVTGDGRYSYKIIDTAATSVTTILAADVLSRHQIDYDTSDVLASTRAGVPQWSEWGPGKTLDSSVNSIYCFADQTISQLLGTSPNGSIYRSQDHGLTWRKMQQLGTEADVLDIRDLGSGKAIASTYPSANVYRTTDYGSSWTLIQRLATEAAIYCMAVLSTTTILAGSGPSGLIFRSLNSGSSWTSITSLSAETDILSVLSLGSGKALAGTSPNGKIFRSLDSGSTWTFIQKLGTKGSIDSLLDLGGGMALAGGGPPAGIHRTADYGSSWTLMQEFAPETIVYSLIRARDGVVFCGTYPTAQVYRSDDYGSSWTYVQYLTGETFSRRMLSLPEGIVIAGTGPAGEYFRTTFNDTTKWQEDDSRKASVMSAYGIDRVKDFGTVFASDADAQAFAQEVEGYFSDLHGRDTIEVPLRYYAVGVGDMVDVEINRSQSAMLGTKKGEIVGKQWNLARGTITFDLRIA